MAFSIKKLKSYLVSVLVFYTILVTYFLAQIIWSDDVANMRRRGGDNKLLNVLYQEEKRHLRSFKDVIKSYGGAAQLNAHKSKREISHNEMGSSGVTSYNSKMLGNSSADILVDENHKRLVHDKLSNYSNSQGNGSLRDAIPLFHTPVSISDDGRELQDGTATQTSESIIASSARKEPNTGNIFIEELDQDLPGALVNGSKINIDQNVQIYSIKESLLKSKDKNSLNNKPRSVNAGDDKNHNINNNNNKSSKNANNSTTSLTQYCDKIDAEEPRLCLSERITFSHDHHVNISPSHLSFKSFRDIHIFSAFLDTRRSPATIRLMVIGPQGRDRLKTSGYWCAFSLPSVLTERFYWNGRKEPVVVKSDQATQLEYYAASVGHGKPSQFYIMSCTVPARHLEILMKFDTSRIHLVASKKNSTVLNAVVERMALDVINNKGISRQEYHSRSTQRDMSQDRNKGDRPNQTSDSKIVDPLSASISSSKSLGVNLTLFNSSDPLVASPFPDSIVSCVAPIFTSLGVVQMVEFLELNLLLGSQHINVYVHHTTNEVKDVLAAYQREGLVTVLPWIIPNTTSIWAHGRDVALNDCLYRSMHRFEFALFHDMDEYFVPRITPDLPSFINFLKSKGGLKSHKTSDLVFSSAYFPPPTKLQSSHLMSTSGYTKDVGKFQTLRSVHRTYFHQQHSLRMIRPVMAYRVGAGERKKTVFNISPRYAAVNHYSQCVGSSSSGSANNKKTNTAGQGGEAAGPDAAATGDASKKDSSSISKPGVACTNTKVDMYLWLFKDKLIQLTKDSIRNMNFKKTRRRN